MQKLVRRLLTLILAITVAGLSTQLWFDFRSPQIETTPPTVSVPEGSNLQPLRTNSTTDEGQVSLPTVSDTFPDPPSNEVAPLANDQIQRLEEQIEALGVQLSQSEQLVAKLKNDQLADFLKIEWSSKGSLDFLADFGYVTVPLLRKIGYFEVKTQINGQNAYFLLDTGAAQSLIGADQADKFDLAIDDLAQAREYVGLGGTAQTSQVAKLETFEVESIRLTGYSLSLVDLSYVNQILEQAGQFPVHGLLGDDYLEAQDAVIDLKNEKLYLKSKP